jgi:hypothetical protein
MFLAVVDFFEFVMLQPEDNNLSVIIQKYGAYEYHVHAV